jgi:hypothetical protein
MALPPLVFKEEALDGWKPAPPAPTAYTVTDAFGDTTKVNVWPTAWYQCCFGMIDVGPQCCVAHCCCGPCTWASALEAAGIEGAKEAAYGRIIANAIPRDSRITKAIGTAGDLYASFVGGQKRGELFEALYGRPGGVGLWHNACLHGCCTPCVYCQEVNAVLVYAKQVRTVPSGEVVPRVTYGPILRCRCCYLVEVGDQEHIVTRLPMPSLEAPTTQLMNGRPPR